MKNLDEENFWKEIGARLQEYQEDPGDDWHSISAAMHTQSTPVSWTMRGGHLFTAVGLAAFLWLVFPTFNEPESQYPAKKETTDSALAPAEIKEPEPVAATEEGTSKKGSERPAPGNETSKQDKAATYQTRETSAASSAQASVNTTPTIPLTKGDNTLSGTGSTPGLPKPATAGGDLKTRRDTDGTTTLSEEAPAPGNKQEYSDARSIPSSSENTSLAQVLPSQGNADAGITEALLKDADTLTVPLVVNDASLGRQEGVEKAEKKKRHNKPAIYFSLTPSLAYHKVIPLKHDEINVVSLNANGIFSSDRLGMAVETGVQFDIGRKWEVYSGLSYYRQDQTVSYVFRSPDGTLEENTDALSYIITPGSETKSFRYRMRNVGASLGLLYHFKGDKLQHKAGGGIQYLKGIGSPPEGGSYDNSRSAYLNYQLLYRFEYLFTRQLKIYVQPTFTQAIIADESLTEPVTIKPYRAGITFGLLYDF